MVQYIIYVNVILLCVNFIRGQGPLNANFHFKTLNSVVKPKQKCGSEIGFQFQTPGKKENIFSRKKIGKIMFFNKNYNFLEFSKSQS